MSQSSHGLIIGRYNPRDGVVVMTHWQADQYITATKHPSLNDGKAVIVGRYGRDYNRALEDHEKWVDFIKNKDYPQHEMPDNDKKIIHANEMKIGFHTLMKILYKYVGNNSIIFRQPEDKPHETQLSIEEGVHKGHCIYDFNRMEAWNIHPKWFNILEETRAGILDSQVDKNEKSKSQCDCQTT